MSRILRHSANIAFLSIFLSVAGCATVATQLTLDNSLTLLKKLLQIAATQQETLGNPEQRRQLQEIQSEVDGVVRTVSEAAGFPPESRRQLFLNALPSLNNSMGKSFGLAKSITSELSKAGALANILNNQTLLEKQEIGNNLVKMYQQLAILKRKMLIDLDQSELAQKTAADYTLNIRLLQELCTVPTVTLGGSADSGASCLKLPSPTLPEDVANAS